jgi:hypothetical protein
VWLDPIPDVRALSELESQARAAPAPEPVRSAERELDDVGGDALVADDHG